MLLRENWFWSLSLIPLFSLGRISSVGRVLDCRAGCRGFNSRDQTNTQVLKMTEKWRYCLCPANGWTFEWLGWPPKMAVPSLVGDVKIVFPISTSVRNTLTLNFYFPFIVMLKQLVKCHLIESFSMRDGLGTEQWPAWTGLHRYL